MPTGTHGQPLSTTLGKKVLYRCAQCNKPAFTCTVEVHTRAAMKGLQPYCGNCSELYEVDQEFSDEVSDELEPYEAAA